MEKFFISLIIIIIIFLITREFWCWYFKINKVAGLLEQQLEEQKRSNELLLKIVKEESKPKIEKMKNEKNSLEG
jgi:hypothetical protein